MPTRDEYEGDLFRRYEKRIVTLELRCDDLEAFCKKYSPIIDALRDADLIATALSTGIDRARTRTLSKWHVVIAICAVLVPPLIGTLTTILVLKA